MTVAAFAPYKVTITPGGNPEKSATKLANYIIDTWMPGHASGAPFIMVPQLLKILLPFYNRSEKTVLDIRLVGNRPCITEMA